jgi:hypothetical protein
MVRATGVGTVIDRSARPAQSPVSRQAGGRVRRLRNPARSPERCTPLDAFPLAVMSLATFLVLFTFMMARLTGGADPALLASTSTAVRAGHSTARAVRTRTSNGAPAAGTATPVAASTGSSMTTSTVVTRASGATGATRLGDE